MTFDKKTFEFNNVKSVYYTAGEGPPLLFFHGGGAFAMAYEDTLTELAQDFFVIAPDLPCFGESDVPSEPWDFSDYADYFSEFITFLGLENLLVVGHSFGGGAALYLALATSAVSKLVLIDALCIKVSEPFGKLLSRVAREDLRRFFTKEIPRDVAEDYVVTNLPKTGKIGRIVKTVKTCVENAEPDLEAYGTPTLIIWADGDRTLPLSYGKALANELPGAELKVVPDDHLYCINNPRKTASYIRAFSIN